LICAGESWQGKEMRKLSDSGINQRMAIFFRTCGNGSGIAGNGKLKHHNNWMANLGECLLVSITQSYSLHLKLKVSL